jgi:16S rRNA (adenine1518-N6/adenine1519-N6)-dimethyltransferase
VSKPVIASIAYVNDILKHYETHAKKRFGQNFIVDANIIQKIVNTSSVDENTVVLEIGPGMGSLTQGLLKKAKHVIAIEIDPLMVELCNKHFSDEPNFTLIHDDVLNVDLKALFNDLGFSSDRLLVVANLPYYITTPIIFKLIESGIHFEEMQLMVQKEVAQRFNATVGTKDYNALSLMIQNLFEVKIALDVSKYVFIPRPAVDSSVINLKRKDVDLHNLLDYFTFLKTAFTQRRKTLYNNLRESYDSPNIKEALESCQLSESIRAEACTHAQLHQVFEILHSQRN